MNNTLQNFKNLETVISEEDLRQKLIKFEEELAASSLDSVQQEISRTNFFERVAEGVELNRQLIKELGGIPRLERGWAPINAESNDLYQFRMSSVYIEKSPEKRGTFLLYYRRPQDASGISAFGISRALETLQNFKFHPEFLHRKLTEGKITEKLYRTLLEMDQLDIDVRAVEDGEFVGPNTPLMIIEGPLWQAQLVETVLLECLDGASGSATRMATLSTLAEKPVIDFGTRRAMGEEGAIASSLASAANGAVGVANTLTPFVAETYGMEGVKDIGTTAHAFTESYMEFDLRGNAKRELSEDELAAYRDYADVFPDQPVVLIDTIQKEIGLKTTIQLFNELEIEKIGVRDDSDISAESVLYVYDYLKDNGLPVDSFFIVISDGLSPKKVLDIREGIEGARGAEFYKELDLRFGVGEQVARPPITGMVYKLAEWEEEDGEKHRVSKASAIEEKASFPVVYTYRDDEKMQDINALPEEEVAPSLRCLQKEVDLNDSELRKLRRAPLEDLPRELFTGEKSFSPEFSDEAGLVRSRIQQALKQAK